MRLLLLFILFPFLVLGQGQRKAVVDSMKATDGDLHRIADIINATKGSRVEQMKVADSGGYVTLTVRVRVDEVMPVQPLTSRPFADMRAGPPLAARMRPLSVPAFHPVLDMDSIALLSIRKVTRFRMPEPVPAGVDVVVVPPMPPLVVYFDTASAVHPIGASRFRTRVAPLSVEATVVPPFPDMMPEPEPLALIPVAMYDIAKVPRVVIHLARVPDIEQKRMPVAEMHLSEEGYSLLEKMEGFSPDLYTLQDGGFTIGFGFFVPFAEGAKWKKGLSWEDAERMIREKVPAYEDQVKKYINVPLTQAEFDALTMMAYNLGGFSKATSIVNDINTDAGYNQLQRDWMRFVHSKAPNVAKGLLVRRKDELKVKDELDYQPERKIQIFKNRK